MEINFTHPDYLFLLAVIPAIVLVHFITLSQKKGQALKFANFDAISRIKGIELYSKNIFILSLTVLISLLLVLSLSGMTIQRIITSSSFSFVISIDSSKSMEANDMIPTRMEAAKQTALNFVDSTPTGTRIGVVSFSGNSFIEHELTQEKSLIKSSIQNIQISSVGGTDLYEAIITSTNMLKQEDFRSVIILSDGQINVGNLDDAIDYANENDVIIHSIAIGTNEGGITSYGLSKIDEDSLKAVAYNTGGEFFRAEDKETLSSSLSNILTLERKKVSFDISNYLLIASIFLFVFEYFLINTRYRIFP